jgi:5-methylcytosine-specific restriction enzyme subunit McrC
MLLYAWHLPQFRADKGLSFEESPDLANLIARVLRDLTRVQLRRGLHRDYVNREEKLRFLRGRIDLLNSARRLELLHGAATCAFDEMDHDILPNRILRSTLLRLSRRPSLDLRLRQDLQLLAARFPHVRHLDVVSDSLFGQIRIARNNASYRLLMAVCRLVWDLRLPTEAAGSDPFCGLLNDELRMGQVFEAFVRNFYALRLPSFRVSAEPLTWPAQGNRALLPSMRTDVTLTGNGRRIVIDTKYYRTTLQERYDRQTVRSGNLYQLFAYLRTQEEHGDLYRVAEGMLLYPTAGQTIDETYLIQGHPVRVATLDLMRAWPEIETHLELLVAANPAVANNH